MSGAEYTLGDMYPNIEILQEQEAEEVVEEQGEDELDVDHEHDDCSQCGNCKSCTHHRTDKCSEDDACLCCEVCTNCAVCVCDVCHHGHCHEHCRNT